MVGLAALALLGPLAASKVEVYPRPNIANTIILTPPANPARGRQIVDGAYQSFSIEFSYMADYGGNNTYRGPGSNCFCSMLIGTLETQIISLSK